jgi:hypothetical protein
MLRLKTVRALNYLNLALLVDNATVIFLQLSLQRIELFGTHFLIRCLPELRARFKDGDPKMVMRVCGLFHTKCTNTSFASLADCFAMCG